MSTLDYDQSLFPLRDSRLPRWNLTRVSSRSECNESESVSFRLTTLATRHAHHVSTRQAISRSLACWFSSTIPQRKERLFVVYVDVHDLELKNTGWIEENPD